MLTLTLMLVRRKSASKTSAGSCKILQWLTPLLGPNLDPKTGPKQSPKRRNVNVIQFRTPILGSIFGPKNGVSHRRILQLPADVLQADLRRTSTSVSVNTRFFSLCVPICFLYSSDLGKREHLRHRTGMTNQGVTTQSSSVTRTRPRGLDKYRTSQEL